MIIYESCKTDVYCTGDIHGNFGVLLNFCQRNLSDCAVVCCGDIGVGFNKDRYYEEVFRHMTKRLDALGIEFYMLRGNHDDPSYFNGDGRKYGIINLVPDYSVLQTPNHNVLMVGGATSVDRMERVKHDIVSMRKAAVMGSKSKNRKTYWIDETPVYDPSKLNDIRLAGISIDCVCTHTSPSFCHPNDFSSIKGFFEKDLSLKSYVIEERATMDNILKWLCENNMRPDTWCYGHYHKHYNELIEGTEYVLLDMCREHGNNIDTHRLRNDVQD